VLLRRLPACLDVSRAPSSPSQPASVSIRVQLLALVTLRCLLVSWRARAILCPLLAVHYFEMFQAQTRSQRVRRWSAQGLDSDPILNCNHFAGSFALSWYECAVPCSRDLLTCSSDSRVYAVLQNACRLGPSPPHHGCAWVCSIVQLEAAVARSCGQQPRRKPRTFFISLSAIAMSRNFLPARSS